MEDMEMEKMRQQMNLLKEKLEKQEIVNDRIVRNAMKKNIFFINRRNICLSILCLLMIPYSYWVFIRMTDFSVAFWIGTSIFMLICLGATIYNSLNLRGSDITRGDLLKVYNNVARAKKFDTNWLLFGIPMTILWLGWFVYEVYRKGGHEEVVTLMIAGGVGVVIGGLLGMAVYFKTQRQYREILDQIEDVTQ